MADDQWTDDNDDLGNNDDGVTTQLDKQDTLLDRGVDDPLDEGYSPPDRPSSVHAFAESGETLDDRLLEEEPEIDQNTEPETDDTYQVGDARSGRLTDLQGDGITDSETDLVARDVGIDGSAASAEEAAVHTYDPDQAFDDTAENADGSTEDTDPHPDGQLVD